MDGTTMDTTGPASLPATETATAGTAPKAAPVVEALKGVGWFSLGLAAMAVEGAGWLARSATQKGREVGPSVAKPLKAAGNTVEEKLEEVGSGLRDVGRAFGKRAQAVEQAMDERIATAVERAGAPVVSEINELKARIQELSSKIENLQTRRENPEATS